MTEAFDGLERTYYLHLPAGHKSSGKLPVVLALHGGGRGDGGSVGFSGKTEWQSYCGSQGWRQRIRAGRCFCAFIIIYVEYCRYEPGVCGGWSSVFCIIRNFTPGFRLFISERTVILTDHITD